MSDRTAWSLAFRGSHLLLARADGGRRVPTVAELERLVGADRVAAAEARVTLPSAAGRVARAFGLDDDFQPPDGYELVGLRAAYFDLPEDLFRAAGMARQKVEWHLGHAFCSSCGHPTLRHPEEEAMACTHCGRLYYARVAPAVIVLVRRGHEILLARSPQFQPGVYSTLAGFVEAGESLEECVHREIAEEVGVRVTNLRYFGSQPHPFPHSLMVGFVADWLSGEIDPDGGEIEDARWFTADALPDLPHPMSIARALIDGFLDGSLPGGEVREAIAPPAPRTRG